MLLVERRVGVGESAGTTGLYDRRSAAVARGEVERLAQAVDRSAIDVPVLYSRTLQSSESTTIAKLTLLFCSAPTK